MHIVPIKLTEDQLVILGQALTQLPYKVAKPIIDDIDKQVQEFVAILNAPEVTDVVIEPHDSAPKATRTRK